MACHCSGCSRSKRISTIRQLQPEVCTKRLKPVGSKTYPSKSNKVYKDRYLAARKWLIWEIAHYKEMWERKKKYKDNPKSPYISWWDRAIKRNGWGVKKYRDARAECKKRGINV